MESELKEITTEEALERNYEAQKFLTFTVDNSRYGVDILTVREIKGWETPTELPNTPNYMTGVINLRGIVIPIFDLKQRFGMGITEANSKNVIIILATDNDDKMIGILVDAVSDIIEAKEEEIKNSPSAETSIDQEYIKGLIAENDGMTILLNTDLLFNIEELNEAYQAAHQQKP